MENTQDKIRFNFTYYAMKLLGKNLYSNPWTAISEIVANGIDAKAPNVYVLVDMRDKEHAIVEIFDDGTGMSYDDLCKKYTLIGRNKRESSENMEGKTLGRKGIGKLAALYLSPKYYLSTKTSSENSSWIVDTTMFSDSDIPTMNKVDDNFGILAKEYWNNCKTGTMIHLTNVNLERIGIEKIKSLKAILSDYYDNDIIKTNIQVCVIDKINRQINFETIKKDICFETMCAIFDNTNNGFKNKLKEEVYIARNSGIPEIDIIQNTADITKDNGIVYEETISMETSNGEIKDVKCELKGWIGIHVSLDKEVLQRNTKNVKKLQLHPNALRLYVRGKLAVANLMNYVGSSQAFANYIEGDISYDVLDDDSLEDASTSSREGYALNDPRVKKLIEFVKTIIHNLITYRSKIGTRLNEIRTTYFLDLEEKQKKLKEEEERKRKEAEEREGQEREAKERAVQENNITKQQNYFLAAQVDNDSRAQAFNTHVIKNNAERINDNVENLVNNHPECKTYEEVIAIALAGSKIAAAANYYSRAKYTFVDKQLNGNLTRFINQYMHNVIAVQYPEITINTDKEILFNTIFNPQDLTVMIENIVSNAYKADANIISVKYIKKNKQVMVYFINNGKLLDDNIDTNRLFEFGYSREDNNLSSHSTGVGLYQIKHFIVDSMKGSVRIYNDSERKNVVLEVVLNEV